VGNCLSNSSGLAQILQQTFIWDVYLIGHALHVFSISAFCYFSSFTFIENFPEYIMVLPQRTLGKGGPKVTGVGLGLMSIGGAYGPAGSDEDRLALLDRAHEIGEWFWDTADVYFDSEDVVGKWIRKNPSKAKDIFLGTKFALQLHADYSQTIDSSPEYVKAACQKSLDRLGVETIDLYYCHRVDGKTPIEKTIQAMVELKRSVYIEACIQMPKY
jgi:aryl-alcohol dehydrogenase-like predicted oxidoreductase